MKGYFLPDAYYCATGMTRKQWTTPEQGTWLKAHSDRFAEAELNDTRKAFFQQVLKGWLEAWPTPDPTAGEVQAAGGHNNAIKQQVVDLDKVGTWS